MAESQSSGLHSVTRLRWSDVRTTLRYRTTLTCRSRCSSWISSCTAARAIRRVSGHKLAARSSFTFAQAPPCLKGSDGGCVHGPNLDLLDGHKLAWRSASFSKNESPDVFSTGQSHGGGSSARLRDTCFRVDAAENVAKLAAPYRVAQQLCHQISSHGVWLSLAWHHASASPPTTMVAHICR